MDVKKNRNGRSKGRQKIAIAKIEEKSNLQVTFSKRRTGLFKKAGELCILSGAEIAILVFSPKDKPYSFAHPNLDSVLNRFLNEEKDEVPRNYDDDTSAPRFKVFNDEYEAALRDLEKEKKKKISRGNNINKASDRDVMINGGGGFWWDSVNVDEMKSLEVEEYASALEELHGNLKRRMRQQMIDAWTTDVVTAGSGGGNGSDGGGANLMGFDNNWFNGGDQGQGANVYGFGYQGNNWQ